MKAVCPCGLPPDPNCVRCGGSGYFEVHFPDEDEVEEFWIGRCPLCGSENGGHFQLTGKPNPNAQLWLPCCINNDCPNNHVQWVNADDIYATWIAVCPICNMGHWCNYLQLTNGPEPSPQSHPFKCPRETCGHSPMSWVRADEV